jgi:hypothetical protein
MRPREAKLKRALGDAEIVEQAPERTEEDDDEQECFLDNDHRP